MFEPGIYKTRNGTEVRVLCNDAPGPLPIRGYITCGGRHVEWIADGGNGNRGFDLMPPVRVQWWSRNLDEYSLHIINYYEKEWDIVYRVELAGDDVVKIERVKRETSNDEG